MSYYKKLGFSKEEWIKKWKKELQHRNWNPYKELQYVNEQIELFEKQRRKDEEREKTCYTKEKEVDSESNL